jgi:hypothetical protein
MDPNEALNKLRELAKKILAIADEPFEDDQFGVAGDRGMSDAAVEMAEQFVALDEWVIKGGFLPRNWEKS